MVAMRYMLVRNDVVEFARWKRIFDSHTEQHRAAGLTLRHLWQAHEAPNTVFFLLEVADVGRAREFLASGGPAVAQEAGVVGGEIHFLDDAAVPAPAGGLACRLVGTWILRSREDRTRDGVRTMDPHLGADPLGILVYDRSGNFAAQFMRRDRSAVAAPAIPSGPGANNSSAVGGYDAYFGAYRVDEASGEVTQTLLGSLSPADVGKVLTRRMAVIDDRLTIELETTASDGRAIVRTLVWERTA